MPVPDDPVLQLDVTTIGSLTESAYSHPEDCPSADVYSFCFWFYAATVAATKVLANQGNHMLEQAGWTVFVRDGSLHVRVNNDRVNGERQGSVQLSTRLAAATRWHHLAVLINQERQHVKAFLDGNAAGWAETAAEPLLEAGSVLADDRLTLGGYTDSAGGHFNYRFGESHAELIDDFRLYTRLLSSAEIRALMPSKHPAPKAAMSLRHDDRTQIVHFDARDSVGEGLTYVWDFGDGSGALGQQVSHRYAYRAEVEVTLSVFDSYHQQDDLSQYYTVDSGLTLPTKTPVFSNGQEGYACFRIPAIVRAANGDLVAFAEGRLAGCSDATQVIHIVAKRSQDGGQSWLPLQVVARNVVAGVDHACMNPAPVVDRIHGMGKIIVVYNKMETSEWAITQGKGSSRVFCSTSLDHGLTWADGQDITKAVHRPYQPDDAKATRATNKTIAWRKHVPTLGHAIQLEGTAQASTRGRLLFIGCYTEAADSVFESQNYAFWSDDLGESWHIGSSISLREDGSSAKGLNEATAVELSDGTIMVNSRNYQDGHKVGFRAVTVGRFDQAGKLHFDKVKHDSGLPDSGVQASLLRLEHSDIAADVLLFANPAHPRLRKQLTLRLSLDGGQSWTREIMIDPGDAAYSDLVALDQAIGILYEQGNQGGIVFVVVALRDLMR